MAQIQAHPWFKQGLPDGAAAMNDTILADVGSRPIVYKQPPEVLAAMLRVSDATMCCVLCCELLMFALCVLHSACERL
jgi:hypothetical protein